VTPATAAPAITTQPANQTVTVGSTATFSVVATGTPSPTYQWRKGGTNITGATASSYTTPATILTDSGAVFSVVVTNTVTSVTSTNATLTVNPAGSTTTPPSLDYSIANFTATEEVTLRSTTPVTFRTEEVRLRSTTPVTFRVEVKNVGTDSGLVSATLVGSLNGVEVYRRTMQVSAPVGTTTTLGFQPYTPTTVGTIQWTVTIQDQGPALNTATATTTIVRTQRDRGRDEKSSNRED
jgi:hypothetical protein